jgi:hypothetical protein
MRGYIAPFAAFMSYIHWVVLRIYRYIMSVMRPREDHSQLP